MKNWILNSARCAERMRIGKICRASVVVIGCLCLLFLLPSCAKKVQKATDVYSNDFENDDLTGINNGIIDSYNNTKVLGRYNNAGFDLRLVGLPQHDLVEITFDLYIHDSWEGNFLGDENVNGPDIWQMKIDGDTYMNTTFSNLICPSGTFCIPQSYPSDYLNSKNNPRRGASKINLPAACDSAATSSLYRIKKIIRHSEAELLLQCVDKLVQTDVPDPLCDESWSVDNINIKVIRLE